MKRYFSAIIRLSGLSRIAEQGRYLIQRLVRNAANRRYAREHPDFVFPPDWYLYETYTLDYKAFAEDGRQTAKEILALTQPFLPTENPSGVILDWGCGPARILRHIPALTYGQYTVIGTDYNSDYVQWGNTNLSGITILHNALQPPVALPDNHCTFIYGISIFTHLSAESHTNWIAELYRLLRPGGVLLLTMQGVTARQKLLPEEQLRFDKGELVIRTYEKEGNRMYAAFQPPAFMQRLFQQFELLRHIPGGAEDALDRLQDTWIVRKPLLT